MLCLIGEVFITSKSYVIAPDAQKEVRELAEEMLNIVKNIEGNPFELTIKAFEL